MVEEYLSEQKNNNHSSNFVTKILLSVILCFLSLIYIKKDDNNLEKYKNFIFNRTFSFDKINRFLNKYLDKNIVNSKKSESIMVFKTDEEIEKIKYEHGVKLKYTENNPIELLESGIAVYVGEKENLGNTIIIQGIDGYDIWYSNVNNSNVKIYDYLEKNTIIGDTNELIITISKDGNYIDYDKYNKEV